MTKVATGKGKVAFQLISPEWTFALGLNKRKNWRYWNYSSCHRCIQVVIDGVGGLATHCLRTGQGVLL
jgi:hypothetical protein